MPSDRAHLFSSATLSNSSLDKYNDMTKQRSPNDLPVRLSNNIGRLLVELAKHFQRTALQKLHDRGHVKIRTSHSAVIGNLGYDTLRLTELAQRGGITQQAMGKLIKELERIGYVQRAVDETDKRARNIQLTERGKQLMVDSVEVFAEVRNEYAEAMGSGHLEKLEQQLGKANEALGIKFIPDDWQS